MSDSMPRELVVTELADGVRYRLPRRKPSLQASDSGFCTEALVSLQHLMS
jgi:hypothetical protein